MIEPALALPGVIFFAIGLLLILSRRFREWASGTSWAKIIRGDLTPKARMRMFQLIDGPFLVAVGGAMIYYSFGY